MKDKTKVGGVILAGGQSMRMGKQDKGLIRLNNRPLVCYSLEAMEKVADKTIISANRNLSMYRELCTLVLTDKDTSFNGPLSGILVALEYFTEYPVILVAPCDCPLIGSYQLKKIMEMREKHDVEVAVATNGLGVHPLFLALKTSLKNSLENFLGEGNRKVVSWLNLHTMVKVDFTGQEESFYNVNSPDDLASLEGALEKNKPKEADTNLHRLS